jgi:hypothetical protein
MFVDYRTLIEVTDRPLQKRKIFPADQDVTLNVYDNIVDFKVDSDDGTNYTIYLPLPQEAPGMMYDITVTDTGSETGTTADITVEDQQGNTVHTFSSIGSSAGESEFATVISMGEFYREVATG